MLYLCYGPFVKLRGSSIPYREKRMNLLYKEAGGDPLLMKWTAGIEIHLFGSPQQQVRSRHCGDSRKIQVVNR